MSDIDEYGRLVESSAVDFAAALDDLRSVVGRAGDKLGYLVAFTA